MAPLPASPGALLPRPLTLCTLASQLSRDDERTTAGRMRLERIASMFDDINSLRAQAQGDIQEALDAIAGGFPERAKTILLYANQHLDALQAKADEVAALRDEQAKAETERAHEADIRRTQLRAARLQARHAEKPWRPDGPGAA
jgi:hypothetical protein